MNALKAFGRWIADWRNGATFAVVLVFSIVGFIVYDAAQARDRSLTAAITANADNQSLRAAAIKQIDALSAQIADLRAQNIELLSKADSNGAQIAALQEQVRQLGGRPVVVTQSPSTTSTTQPSPATTTTTTTAPPRSCLFTLCR